VLLPPRVVSVRLLFRDRSCCPGVAVQALKMMMMMMVMIAILLVLPLTTGHSSIWIALWLLKKTQFYGCVSVDFLAG
jgi:hypothetical protein